MKKIFIVFLLSFIIWELRQPLSVYSIQSAIPETAGQNISVQTETSKPGFIGNDRIMPIPSTERNEISLLGQNHYYTVTFRGNGEAVVNLKVVLSNINDDPLSTISLRVPKVDPKDITVYQVVRESQCIRYKAQLPKEIQNGQTYEQNQELQTLTIYPPSERPKQICDEYQEPDYYQYWYGKAEYKKASYTLSGDTIEITLPEEIKTNKSGSFFVYFRALGYAKKNVLGTYQFSFETLKVNDKISQLQVGLATDSDLILRGAKASVNYRFEEGVAALKSGGVDSPVVRSTRFDQFFNQIGQGSITKTSSNLQPLESYSVKGTYADSWYKLYAKEVVLGIFVFAFFIIMLFFLIKLVINFIHRHTTNMATNTKKSVTYSAEIVSVLSTFSLSFVSSLLILIYTIFIYFILQNINRWFYHDIANSIIFVLLIVISIGIYGLIGLIPAIIMGIKRGVWWGVGTFILTLGWLLFYLGLIFIFLYISNSNSYPYPSPTFSKPIPMRTSIDK